MKKVWKSIRVPIETHNRVKVLAAMAGENIDVFVGILADTYERYEAQSKRPTQERTPADYEGAGGG